MNDPLTPKANRSPVDAHIEAEMLNEYLDGCLSKKESAALEGHLQVCTVCAAHLDQLRSVFVSLEGMPEVVLTRDLSADVLAAIRPRFRMAGILKWGALAQLLVAFVLLLVSLPAILRTWVPVITQTQEMLLAAWLQTWVNWLSQLTTMLAEVQLLWAQWLVGWQSPSAFTTSQVAIWPVFLAAILLFFIGNGLLLRRVAGNGAK